MSHLLDLKRRLSGQYDTLVLSRFDIELCDNDHHAALVLGQLLYWTDRTQDPHGWIAKTYEDWQEELMLSKYQMARATKALGNFVETKRKKSKYYQGKTVLHYRINGEALEAAMIAKLQTDQSDNLEVSQETKVKELDFGKATKVKKLDLPYTESTTETTKERDSISGEMDERSDATSKAPPASKDTPKPATPTPPPVPTPPPTRTDKQLARLRLNMAAAWAFRKQAKFQFPDDRSWSHWALLANFMTGQIKKAAPDDYENNQLTRDQAFTPDEILAWRWEWENNPDSKELSFPRVPATMNREAMRFIAGCSDSLRQRAGDILDKLIQEYDAMKNPTAPQPKPTSDGVEYEHDSDEWRAEMGKLMGQMVENFSMPHEKEDAAGQAKLAKQISHVQREMNAEESRHGT